MKNNRKITIMLVDGDPQIQNDFRATLEKHDDFELVKIATGEKEALDFYSNNYPDVIVTEMIYTQGDSLHTLNAIRELEKEMPKKSYIIVTTYAGTPVIMNMLYSERLIDFSISKSQVDFGAGLILTHLNLVKKYFNNGIVIATPQRKENERPELETPAERDRKMQSYFEKYVLNRLVIKPSLYGRKYLVESYVQGAKYNGKGKITLSNDIYPEVAKVHNTAVANIDRCINKALEVAWESTEPEILKEVYPINVDPKRGVPTGRDFLFYHLDKLNDIFGFEDVM